MLAHMKAQTTGALTEISITVPAEDAARVTEAIRGVLALTGHTVQRVNEDGEELYSAQEVFPEGHPGMVLQGLRIKEDLTQGELAEKLGTTQNRISEMETGKRAISKKMASKIAATFNLDYRILL